MMRGCDGQGAKDEAVETTIEMMHESSGFGVCIPLALVNPRSEEGSTKPIESIEFVAAYQAPQVLTNDCHRYKHDHIPISASDSSQHPYSI